MDILGRFSGYIYYCSSIPNLIGKKCAQKRPKKWLESIELPTSSPMVCVADWAAADAAQPQLSACPPDMADPPSSSHNLVKLFPVQGRRFSGRAYQEAGLHQGTAALGQHLLRQNRIQCGFGMESFFPTPFALVTKQAAQVPQYADADTMVPRRFFSADQVWTAAFT